MDAKPQKNCLHPHCENFVNNTNNKPVFPELTAVLPKDSSELP